MHQNYTFMPKSILIADDEKDIWEMLDYTFTREGYETFYAENGQKAIEMAKKYNPEVILLDIMMPEMDGIEVCRNLRNIDQFTDTTILFLTARGEEYSEIAGFEAGADDYIVKPVKLRSLVKRLNVISGRKSKVVASETLKFKRFSIDRDRYVLIMDGNEIKIPKKEFELVYLLASNKDKVITRQQILEDVWGKEVVVVDRTIDVHIRRIRKKIGSDIIQTIKGVGYKLVDN